MKEYGERFMVAFMASAIAAGVIIELPGRNGYWETDPRAREVVVAHDPGCPSLEEGKTAEQCVCQPTFTWPHLN